MEEITHKTGSFKKFDVFVSMLRTALSQQEEGLHIDVLTYADLLALKSRKSGNAEQTATARDSAAVGRLLPSTCWHFSLSPWHALVPNHICS